jgi:hypothetical protein
MNDVMIVIVSADDETATCSLIEAKKRLNMSLAEAEAANQLLFEAYSQIDPEDEDLDPEDRISGVYKISQVEEEARLAWKRYTTSLVKYQREEDYARRRGIIS